MTRNLITRRLVKLNSLRLRGRWFPIFSFCFGRVSRVLGIIAFSFLYSGRGEFLVYIFLEFDYIPRRRVPHNNVSIMAFRSASSARRSPPRKTNTKTKDWSEEKEDGNTISITVRTPPKTHTTPINVTMTPKKKETTFSFYFPKPTTATQEQLITPSATKFR
jgi:hypothetical protein